MGLLEEYIMEGIGLDFSNSVEGWVTRILFTMEQWRDSKSGKKASGSGGGGIMGFWARLTTMARAKRKRQRRQ